MKKIFLAIILLSTCTLTSLFAADYASVKGEPLSALTAKTSTVAIVFDTDDAKVNGMAYKAYLQSLTDKDRKKFNKDIAKLKTNILKQFNKANKHGFQLVDNQAQYVAQVKISDLTFSTSKTRAKLTATVDFREQNSSNTLTQIIFNNFEGAKKSGRYNQLKQLSKDIIEYITIYL